MSHLTFLSHRLEWKWSGIHFLVKLALWFATSGKKLFGCKHMTVEPGSWAWKFISKYLATSVLFGDGPVVSNGREAENVAPLCSTVVTAAVTSIEGIVSNWTGTLYRFNCDLCPSRVWVYSVLYLQDEQIYLLISNIDHMLNRSKQTDLIFDKFTKMLTGLMYLGDPGWVK